MSTYIESNPGSDTNHDGIVDDQWIISHGGDFGDDDQQAAQDRIRASGESEESIEDSLALYEGYSEISTAQSLALIDANVAASQEMAQYNVDQFPTYSNIALQTTGNAATELNTFMQDQFEASLDSIYPTWRTDMVGAAAGAQQDSIALTAAFEQNVLPGYLASVDQMSVQAMANTNAQRAGEVNPDVAAQMERYNAEVYQQIGVRGQSADYLTARDLGMTSYQMQQQGLANSQMAMGIAPTGYSMANQTLQMPTVTGMQNTNLINAYRAPMVDASAMYTSHLGIVSGAGMINPTSTYQANSGLMASQQALGASQAQFAQEASSQQYWNSINYSAQQQAYNDAQVDPWIGMIQGGISGGQAGAAASGGNPYAAGAGAAAGGYSGYQNPNGTSSRY